MRRAYPRSRPWGSSAVLRLRPALLRAPLRPALLRPALLWFAASALAGCAAPDAAESALLLLDRGAREHGIELEVAGATVERAGVPLAVDVHDETYLVRDGAREPLVLAQGELVEIDAEGAIRRGPVDPDRLTIAASPESAATLAEMLGGAEVERIGSPSGPARFALRAPGITWLAAALHGLPDLPDVRAESAFEAGLASGDGSWQGRRDATFAPIEARPGAADPALATPDAAALVGVYQVGDVLLVLDAAGGYSLGTAEGSTRGTYRPAPGGLVLAPRGGAEVAMRLYGEALVDEVGLALAPARPST